MEHKEILLENINRQRKLMGLNEMLDVNVNADNALSNNKVDAGIVPMEESENDDFIDEDENFDDAESTLNELQWFKNKMKRLGSFLSRNKNGDQPSVDTTDYGNNTRSFDDEPSGASPLDNHDIKIAGDIDQNLKNAEDEYDDDDEEPKRDWQQIPIDNSGEAETTFDLSAMDQNLKNAEDEYPEPTPKMSVTKQSLTNKAKAIAPRKGQNPTGDDQPGSPEPFATTEPILGKDVHPTSPAGGEPNQNPTMAHSVSNPGQKVKLNYNIK